MPVIQGMWRQEHQLKASLSSTTLRNEKRFLFLVSQQGLLLSLVFCALVLIKGSHLTFTITGARELGQAAKVP